MYGPITYAALEMAKAHGITPDKCSRCKQGTDNWQGPQVDGTTQAIDDGCLVWQCKGCGNIVRLTAEQIEHLAHHGDDQDHEEFDLVQVVELTHEPYTNERWIFVPAHLADHGEERHVVLTFGADEALALAETLYGMVRMDMAHQEHAVAELRAQLN